MTLEATILRVERDLDETFNRLDNLFNLPEELREFKPSSDQWSIDEILEHITLTSHFLLITLSQSLKKAIRRAQEQPIPTIESNLDKILVISDPDAFAWIRPEHMEPTGKVASEVIRDKLKAQHAECENILAQIPNGEGLLHRVSMSVQSLGKLDMYEWLYFLVQHARRHIIEIERICENYQTKGEEQRP